MTSKCIDEVRAGLIQELLGSQPKTLSVSKLKEHSKAMLTEVRAFESSIRKISAAQTQETVETRRKS